MGYLVRCGSRHKEHGSWRAGFHWPAGGDKDAVVSKEQVLELKADPNISLVVVGKTTAPLTRRDDAVNELRAASDAAPVVDESFLADLPDLDAKASGPSLQSSTQSPKK